MKTEFTPGKALTALGDLFLPRRCAACGRPLDIGEQHLCIWCASDFPKTYYWQRTHNPMADRFNACLERHFARMQPGMLSDPQAAYGTREPYAYAASLFLYHSEAGYKRIPQDVKYRGDLSSGAYFGRMLGAFLHHSAVFRDVDAVLPVPLHWTRYWQRGYNQAEIIASAIAQVLGVPLRNDILYRVRPTRTQTRLGVEAKQSNVESAFRIRPHALPRLKQETFRHIMLVDDVFTTGATLSACFLALREVLPRTVRISIATLACVDR